MITMLGSPRKCCDGITRRETLKAGGLSLIGGMFGAPAFAKTESNLGVETGKGKAKSVIVLYLLGGAPTQDMFDMKPNAPAEVRGEFNPIETSAPGIQVCELLPQTSRWMHKAALVRTVNHRGGCHNPLPSYSGSEEPLADLTATTTSDNYPPSMGSVCEYLAGGKKPAPDYVYLPNYLGWGQSIRRPGPYAGFLGHRYDPYCSECDPSLDKDVLTGNPWWEHPPVFRGKPQLVSCRLPEGVTVDRLDSRRTLLNQFESQLSQAESDANGESYGRARQQAFQLLSSAPFKAAFDLEKVDPVLRERYGNTLFGASAIVGRRLVEAGVRFVNVTWDSYRQKFNLVSDYAWDTHYQNFKFLRLSLLNNFDVTFSALMEDLVQHGLLDETLVVVMSDFGRTPKINGNSGRDHWTHCYTVLFAGAGVKGGTVYGTSDRQAAFPQDNPVRPADICATIYHCLGIDPEMLVHDRSGRPIAIAHGGQPIREILA